MTAHKHFKHLVRTRMTKTGESYTTARRQILRDEPARKSPAPVAKWHQPGSIPATTALRVVLTAAGVNDPTTNKPLTEAMLFGIAGGVGAGVAQFRYEKEDFSSLFLAGRHLWHDDEAYLRGAIGRIGMKCETTETAGAKAADKHLRDALEGGSPCVAWVDMAHLPHRALPASWSGGGYHVISVYSIDDAKHTALIGDLADDPIEISLENLATARGRIKKFKNRVLRITNRCERTYDLGMRVRSGIKACHAGLGGKPMKGYPTTFNLDAFDTLAKRVHGSKDKDSWDNIFPPGKHLWTALTSMHQYIEHYHTGGGLCRPIMAVFLSGAADVAKQPKLREVAKRYADLGEQWTGLANAALPVEVAMFKQARQLHARRAELTSSESAESASEIRSVYEQLAALHKQAAERFPLSADESNTLRRDLQTRIRKIHADEVSAREALGLLVS
jgi:hypothetical protein